MYLFTDAFVFHSASCLRLGGRRDDGHGGSSISSCCHQRLTAQRHHFPTESPLAKKGAGCDDPAAILHGLGELVECWLRRPLDVGHFPHGTSPTTGADGRPPQGTIPKTEGSEPHARRSAPSRTASDDALTSSEEIHTGAAPRTEHSRSGTCSDEPHKGARPQKQAGQRPENRSSLSGTAPPLRLTLALGDSPLPELRRRRVRVRCVWSIVTSQ